MRTSKKLFIGIGFLLLSLGALILWNKYDYCQGWAEHYSNRAQTLRIEAEQLDLDREQIREYMIAADMHDLISGKYAKVASYPWLKYPSYPLVTAEEQQRLAAKW